MSFSGTISIHLAELHSNQIIHNSFAQFFFTLCLALVMFQVRHEKGECCEISSPIIIFTHGPILMTNKSNI